MRTLCSCHFLRLALMFHSIQVVWGNIFHCTFLLWADVLDHPILSCTALLRIRIDCTLSIHLKRIANSQNTSTGFLTGLFELICKLRYACFLRTLTPPTTTQIFKFHSKFTSYLLLKLCLKLFKHLPRKFANNQATTNRYAPGMQRSMSWHREDAARVIIMKDVKHLTRHIILHAVGANESEAMHPAWAKKGSPIRLFAILSFNSTTPSCGVWKADVGERVFVFSHPHEFSHIHSRLLTRVLKSAVRVIIYHRAGNGVSIVWWNINKVIFKISGLFNSLSVFWGFPMHFHHK